MEKLPKLTDPHQPQPLFWLCPVLCACFSKEGDENRVNRIPMAKSTADIKIPVCRLQGDLLQLLPAAEKLPITRRHRGRARPSRQGAHSEAP